MSEIAHSKNQVPAGKLPPRGQAGASTLRVIVVIAVLAVLGGLIWFTGSRMRELNRELDQSEKRVENVNRRLRNYSQELELALERARAARAKTTEAEQQAEQATTARHQAEQQAQKATVAQHQAEQQAQEATKQKEQAQQQAQAALVQTKRTKAELEQVRKRREAELDRMQEALNRIAPTKRTPAGMVMTLGSKNFRFDFDKTTLRARNKEMLSRIAGVLLASEGYHLFIDGHTDDIGTAEYNQRLSLRRAKAVRDYLVGAGVPPGVITIKGFGKSQPLVKGKTRAARAKNRRVEIGIVDTIVHYGKMVRH